MHKKFILSVLSCASLLSVAQAGKLVLEAELSEEQKAGVMKKFVEPYVADINHNSHAGLVRTEGGWIRYPHLRPLKTMRYTTDIAFKIDEKEAELIAQAYINNAERLAIDKISTPLFVNPTEPCYKTAAIRSSLKDPGLFSSDDRELKSRVLEISATSNPTALQSLQDKVVEELGSQIEYIKNKSNSFGGVYFAKIGFFEPDYDPKWPTDDRDWLALDEMHNRICQLYAKEVPLTLTFTKFNLKYIGDDNKEIFRHSIDLSTLPSQ